MQTPGRGRSILGREISLPGTGKNTKERTDLGRELGETMRMNGPQAFPAQPWAWADSLASEGKSYGYSRTVPSQLGPLPRSRQFWEEDACFCLFPKVRFGHGRALSCPHRSSGVNSHCHSQRPHHPLPGTQPSRPS